MMTNVVLDVSDRLLTKYFVFGRYWRNSGSVRAILYLQDFLGTE